MIGKSIVMKEVICSILLATTVSCTVQSRIRRQTIPSDHIKVHSLHSKIFMDRYINIASTQSKVQLMQKTFDGIFWSETSKIQFDASDTFVNASFNSAYFYFNVSQCQFLYGFSHESSFFLNSNTTTSYFFTFTLYDSANLTMLEDGIQVQINNAPRIEIQSHSWEKHVDKTFSISSEVNPDTGKIVGTFTVISSRYKTAVSFYDAPLMVKYGNKVVAVAPNFQYVDIDDGTYRYRFSTKKYCCFFKINFENEMIKIENEYNETNVVVSLGEVTVHCNNLSRTDVEHDNGEFFLNGERLNANNLSTFALFSTVQLLKNGILRADFSGSRTVFATKLQNVGLTADHQEIRVIGGVRGISVETDDFLFEVGYTNEPLQLVGFVLPDDFIRPMGRFEENINVISTFPSPTHINYTNDKDCFGITYPTSDFSTKTILTTPIWEDFNNVTVTPSYQESSTFNSISDFSTDSTYTVGYNVTVTPSYQESSTSNSISDFSTDSTYTVGYNVTLTPSSQESSTSNSISDFSTDSTYTVGLTEDFTTLPLSTETTTTSYPSTATIESSSIPIFPLPSNFSTDGFVIGHWFTTEKSRLETTTMPSQIAFTATIQNIDLSTKENAVNTDIPQPNDLNLNVDMTKPSTTNAPVLYTTEIEELFPNPSPLPDLKNKTEKMFILKLKIPEEIDEKSVQLLKNLTSSMKRLA